MRAMFATVAACLGFVASWCVASAGPAALNIPNFTTQDAAQAHCPQDTVVWLDSDSGIYYLQGDAAFGKANPGAYVCQKDADGAGFSQVREKGKNAALQSTPAPSVTMGTAIFQTLVPTRNQDMAFDCGGGRDFVASMRSYDQNGDYKVTYTWYGLEKPIAPSSFLSAHDADDDVDIVGYFDSKGTLTKLSRPALAVPIKPSPGWQATIPRADGTSYTRTWAGSSTITVPYGTLDVEIYSSGFSGFTEYDAFSNNVGLTQVDLESTDKKPILTCRLAKVDPK
jgi:hypothetical protein